MSSCLERGVNMLPISNLIEKISGKSRIRVSTPKELNNNLASIKEGTARPKGLLKPELIRGYNNEMTVPMGLGWDGFIYGGSGGGRRQLVKSDDGFETITAGADMAVETGDSAFVVQSVNRTRAGYVVVGRRVIDGVRRGSVWFSENFEGPYTETLLADKQFAVHSISYYNQGSELEDIVLLGEYTLVSFTGEQPSPHKLYLSKDGGQTFEEVLQTKVIDPDPAVNSHWHHSIYDPYTGRIFASNGDGENRAMYVSDDLGESWKEMRTPENEYGLTSLQQPTLLIPTSKKILLGPDLNTPGALLSLVRDEEYTQVHWQGSENWKLNWEITVDETYANIFFPQQPYGISGDEIYILFPSSAGNPDKRFYVVASGDGGNTWHKVYGLRLPGGSMNEGIVGPDANGYLCAYVNTGTTTRIWRAKKLDWIYG